VLEKRVLRIIFGHKREEATGSWINYKYTIMNLKLVLIAKYY
jgi:hypothetical protein